MEDKDLIELYKLAVNEVARTADASNKRLLWFTGLISALIVAPIVGLTKLESWQEFALLSLSPLLGAILAGFAIQVLGIQYRTFLERLSMKSKYEQLLGLTAPQELPENLAAPYWENEPIVPQRWTETHRKFDNGEAWIVAHLGKGWQRWTTQLLRGTQLVAVALFAALLAMAIDTYPESKNEVIAIPVPTETNAQSPN